MNFESAINYFIPETKHRDPELFKRHRFLIVSMITTLFLSIFYVNFFYFIEFTPGVFIVSGYVICHILFLALSRLGTSLYIIGNLFACMTFFGFTYGSATSGGVSSAVIAWLLSTKVSSFWYADKKAGYFWSFVTILTVSVFLGMEVYGYEFPLMYNLDYRSYFSGTMHIGVLIYYVVVLKVYEGWKDESILQLKNTVEEKENILQVVGHDLRNPLTVLILRLQRAKKLEDPKQLQHELGLLEAQVQNLVSITNNLLWPENSQKKKFNIIDFVKELTDDYFREIAAKKSIVLKLDLPKESLEVDVNEVHLLRVLQNLVSNAIKYSNPGSEVNIRIKAETDNIVILVEDEGLGFSSEELKVAFKRHAGISNQPTSGEDSVGLGLSITKDLVEQLGGDISVLSEGKGLGSIFKLKLKTSSYTG